MGYIFDALNRSNGEKPQRRPADAMQPQHAVPRDTQQAHATPQPRQAPTRAAASFEPIVLQPDISLFDDRLVAVTEPSSIMAEEYRAIRTGILARWQQKRHLVHTITSATPQEGKTITSLNLGFAFAELRNRRTLVIEADLRLPTFSKLLSLPECRGLVHVLEENLPVETVIQRVGGNNLHLISAGRRIHNNAGELLSSPTMVSLLKRLRDDYDHVIIDTPPVVELADAGIVGSMSDDVLLIARLQHTPRPLVEQAVRTLTSYNASVSGVIATDHKRHHQGYKYGYRYGYAYSSQRAAA